MDTKDILKATDSTKRLIQDDAYYKYIFKKTERIVSVVFYITQSLEVSEKSKTHVEDIEHAARQLHDAVLRSLNSRAHVAEDIIQETIHALIVLESKLRVAQTTGMIAPDVLSVIVNETDSVLRGIGKYTQDETVMIDRTATESVRPTPPKRVTEKVATAPTAATATPPAAGGDRRARILTVIEAKGEVSIKDIAAIITDVSEKTIQRELNTMIEDSLIKRVGERRWSKYMLF